MMHSQFTPNLPGSNNGAASTRGRAVDQYDRGFNGADAQQDDVTDYEAMELAHLGKLTTQGYHDDGFVVEDGDSLSEEEFSESEEEFSESEEEESDEEEEEEEDDNMIDLTADDNVIDLTADDNVIDLTEDAEEARSSDTSVERGLLAFERGWEGTMGEFRCLQEHTQEPRSGGVAST